MATYRAIGSVAEAVVRLLEQSWKPSLLNGLQPQFEVYQGKDFINPMNTGISVFVYQVTVDKVQRSLPPAQPNHRRPLPVVVSLILTAWAQDVSTEHVLLGWAMRAIDDNPVLSSAFLNSAVSDVFGPDETVELVPGELTNDEVFQMWQALPKTYLQLSVGYLARVLRIESEIVEPAGGLVKVRELQMSQAQP
jgi:Pvc16 N-terminal domain